MASVQIKVDGLRELGDAMRLLSSDVNGKISRAATMAGASAIRKLAAEKAPVDTGNLKRNVIVKRLPPAEAGMSSMHIVTVRKGKITKAQKKRGLQDAFYARFVEFGTVKMAPQPFLRPAFDQGKEKAVTAIVDRLRKRIDLLK